MLQPKVSILVPVYGVEKYIERNVRSVLSQHYPNYEVIYVNDATKDDSVSILKETLKEFPNSKDRVKIIEHECNKGLGAARLSGLLAATGEYVWFVDSDDWIAEEALSRCFESLCSKPDCIRFGYNIVFENRIEDYAVKPLNVFDVLTHKQSPSIWGGIFKRDLFVENDIFPENGINHSEDFYVVSRLLNYIKTQHIVGVALYNYDCTNESSYMHNINLASVEQAAEVSIRVLDFYRDKDTYKDVKKSFVYLIGFQLLRVMSRAPHSKYIPLLKKRLCELSGNLYNLLCFSNNTIGSIILKVYRKSIC